jgi:hypothetical protein
VLDIQFTIVSFYFSFKQLYNSFLIVNEEDFNYFKDIEEVDLYDPSIESYKKYYGHLSEIVLEDFLVHLPETDDEAGNVSDDDFFDFLECA